MQPRKNWHDQLKNFAEKQGMELTPDVKNAKNLGQTPANAEWDKRQVSPISPDRRATAPYNFVPINEQILVGKPYAHFHEYDTEKDEHGKPRRHTGYIELEIETVTPLYIRDTITEPDYRNGKTSKQATDFFSPADEPRIPGSSLRGMIRQLVEILTWSKITTDRKRVFHYRSFADMSSLREEYMLRMNPESQGGGFGQYSMNAGYLQKVGMDYQIRPAQKKSRNDNKRIASKQFYPIPISSVNQIANGRQRIGYFYQLDDGFLVESGPMPEKRHQWIINPADNDPNVQPILVDERDIRDYGLDANRKGPDILKVLKDHRLTCVPCFYSEWRDSENRKRVSFGHTPMFRLAYKRMIEDLLPEEHKNEEAIDIAESLFGRIHKDRPLAGRVYFEDAYLLEGQTDVRMKKNIPEILSTPKPTTIQHYLVQRDERADRLLNYNSDTYIRGFKAYWHRDREGMVQKLDFPYDRLMRFLHRRRLPVPSQLVRERSRAIIPDFSEIKDERLREAIFKFILEEDKENSQYAVITPIKPGTKFKAKIRFENLEPFELGALLAACDPFKKHQHHKLGMGKPLGMGSIKITPKLFLSNRQARYSSFATEWQEPPAFVTNEELSHFIRGFYEGLWERMTSEEKGGAGSALDTYRLKQLRHMLDWNNIEIDNWHEHTRYLEIAHPENRNEYKDRRILPLPEEVVRKTETP